MDFVIGHPRSGTMLLSRLFNVVAPGVSGHELLYPLCSDMVWVPSEYYAGKLDAEPVRRLLSHYRAASERIDANWKLTWILPVLLEQFPEARVVHLARSPWDNIRSCYNLDYYGTSWSDSRAAPNPRRDYFLRWMPRIAAADWERLDPLEKNCVFWSESHRLALSAAGRAGRYLLVRLEELPRLEVATRLLEFLELPAPPHALGVLAGRFNAKDDEKEEVARLRGSSLPERGEWPRAALELVERRCGAIAARLGYAG